MYRKLISFLFRERLELLFGKREKLPQHWCRVVMDKETETLIRNLPCEQLDTIEISGNKWAGYGFKTYKELKYPEFDICREAFPQQSDLVIAEQVFEHLMYPYRALRNVYSMLKPGGHFLITTPFLLRVHEYPIDCSRWTEDGLRYFLHEGGFELADITTGSWGNEECVVSNFNRWTPYNPLIHSLENNSRFPVVVWALARKSNEPRTP